MWSRGFSWFGRAMAVLGALLLAYGLWLLGDTGSFDPFPEGEAHRCTSLQTGVAISDAVLDPATGIAYLAGKGALYALDLRAAEPLQRMTPLAAEDLHPGGLGLYSAADGARVLFVIDHHPGAERVKIYDVAGRSATHRETIADPAFRRLSGIAPVSTRRFYATNGASRLMRPFETLFRLPMSEIVYFDGTLADPAARGLSAARGLVLGGDGARLYVAEATPHRIRLYARDASTGALREERRARLRAVPDKLGLGADGAVWLAGQARLFRLFLHRLDERYPVPSQILRFDPALGAPRVVYADDGDVIADARVVLYGEGVLVMAGTQPKLLLCRAGL